MNILALINTSKIITENHIFSVNLTLQNLTLNTNRKYTTNSH